MKYQIEKQSKVPAYLQLYEQIRQEIISEVYPLDSKLPSKRLMTEETGISIITVEHAYALLQEEGYIQSRERSGYFVCFRKNDGFAGSTDIRNEEYGNAPISAEQHEFPFSVLSKTMRKVISEYGEEILDRSPNEGTQKLRSAISRYLERSRGIKADASQIIIGAGSEYLYNLIAGLLGRDKIYAIEAPSYKRIEEVYQSIGIQYEKLALGRDGITSEALKNSKADVLHVTPYRSYPSGVSASASKRHEYLRWAKEQGRYIIEDDYESEFSVLRKPEDTLFSQSEQDNVIYMNTFSKTISPALRTGYMILPKHLVQSFDQALGFYSCTVPTYIQFVLAELIDQNDFERHINRVRRNKRKQLTNTSE